MPDLRVGDAAVQSDKLNTMDFIGLQSSRDQVTALKC